VITLESVMKKLRELASSAQAGDAPVTPSALESGLAKLRDAHRDWCGIGLSTEKGLSDEEVAALLAKIEALEWQPIETAPRDGTRILLATPTGKLADGMWSTRYGVWSWPYVMTEPTHWLPQPIGPAAYRNPQHAGGGE
jgi:hypothetical protein